MKTELNATKSVVTVSEMAAMCNLSRSRWYEMVEAGTFPQPVRIPSIKRPVYDQELIEKCLEIRRTCVGLNGPVSFNRKPASRAKTNVKKSESKSPSAPQVDELFVGIKALGIATTSEGVRSALCNLFPSGTDGIEQGELIRKLFLHLQQKKP